MASSDSGITSLAPGGESGWFEQVAQPNAVRLSGADGTASPLGALEVVPDLVAEQHSAVARALDGPVTCDSSGKPLRRSSYR